MRDEEPPTAERSNFGSPQAIAALAAAAFFMIAVLRMGWVSDDAFILIRSVDNLLAGHGFAINPGARVQSFTSPLWALICVPLFALLREPFHALAAGGLLASLGLVLTISWGHRAAPLRGATALLALAASSSFLHYSTSGLENPLAHALLAAFALERLHHGTGPTRLSLLLAALVFLTRFDYLLLLLPSLFFAVAREPRRALSAALPALACIGAWFVFSILYFGFPFPNTAYAKLNTAIPLGSLVSQGLSYLVDSAGRDPVVLALIAFAGLVALQPGVRKEARNLVFGVMLYLLYVLYVGGDFMSGRFLTVCYLVSVLVLVDLAPYRGGWLPAAGAASFLLLATTSFQDRRSDPRRTECFIPESGIVDERECYVEHTGLAQNIRRPKWRSHSYLHEFEKAAARTEGQYVVFDLAGMVSYANTGGKHIIERYALTEPLLARIRFSPAGGWRIGHFFRGLPPGYLESLSSGRNLIRDPCIHDLYDRLQLVTRGPIFSWERFQAIVALNTLHGTCPSP